MRVREAIRNELASDYPRPVNITYVAEHAFNLTPRPHKGVHLPLSPPKSYYLADSISRRVVFLGNDDVREERKKTFAKISDRGM
ncbi:jg20824 [Pararge aegeria aegeria]|uniref:Jg20824 protein n=1 Tax=Pararge aegeria aegeria TaxID=348720 RepID=A0A8S4R7P7_9NEOP|nr:jg20824 [Pararge aegeria aegeria]